MRAFISTRLEKGGDGVCVKADARARKSSKVRVYAFDGLCVYA